MHACEAVIAHFVYGSQLCGVETKTKRAIKVTPFAEDVTCLSCRRILKLKKGSK